MRVAGRNGGCRNATCAGVCQRPATMTTRTEGPRRSMPREPHGNGKIRSGRHKSAPTQPSRRNFLEESQTRSTSSAEALTSQRHTHYNGAIRTILLALKLPRLTCHDVLSGLCGAPGLLQLREKVCMQLRKELYVGCRQRWRTPAAQDTISSLNRGG